jgi:hypothetical protein
MALVAFAVWLITVKQAAGLLKMAKFRMSVEFQLKK